MKKPKQQKLSNKELAIALVSTLSEDKCKKAYMLLMDEFKPDKTRYIRLNANGVVAIDGLIKIKPKQHEQMLTEYSEFKYHWLIKRLHSYLEYLKELADKGDINAKRKFKLYRDNSSYARLTKGWVMEEYLKEARPQDDKKPDFFSIENEAQALDYIMEIPFETLEGSPELDYLVARFTKVREYVEEQMNG